MRALVLLLYLLLGCSGAVPSTEKHVSIRLLILLPGQSNQLFPGRGETGSLAAVGYFAYSHGRPTDGTLGAVVDLVGKTSATGGADYTIGRILTEAGVPCDIINLTSGSTHYNEMMPLEPGASEGVALLAQIPTAIAGLKARHPNAQWIVITVHDQGTTDARVPNAQYQSGAGYIPGTNYPGWSLGYRGLPRVGGAAQSWHDALEDAVSTALGKRTSIAAFIIESNRALTGQTFPFTVQDQQLVAAGSPSRLIPLRDTAGFDVADQVHMIAASCTITTGLLPGTYADGGFHWKGTVVATNYILPYWQSLMGQLSTYSKNAALNNKRNKGTYTPPANHWFAAYVGGVRKGAKSITNNSTLWAAASGRTKSTAMEIAWDAAGSSWGDVDEVRIFDADPAGASNELGRCTLPSVINITTGEILRIASGSIQLTMPAGSFVDSEARSSLDMLFGGTAETPRTTTHVSYWLGSPASGGSLLGSSVSVTQATTWGAASNGQQVTATDISIAQQITATHVAEHTASGGGGTLISVFTVQTPPGSGVITAGRLQSSLT